MVAAGCKKIYIGVETFHPEVFKMVKKAETIEQIKKCIKIAVKYFDSVTLLMIIGLPGDTAKRSLFSYREAKFSNFFIISSLDHGN